MPRLPNVLMVVRRLSPLSCRFAFLAALGLGAAAPARSQVPGDDARCWAAVRIAGPEAMRVNGKEADARIRLRCRPGDALVFLSDTGQPLAPFAARYCDLARTVVIERATTPVTLPTEDSASEAGVGMLTCVYRGMPRADR